MGIRKAVDNTLRESGIPSVGSLPWGSHFCQFYRTKKDLVDVLVPFFIAGLENNESCVWVTPGILREEVAGKAMEMASRQFHASAATGQMEIVPLGRWMAQDGGSSGAILSRLDKAIADGFDGLRIACASIPGKAGKEGCACCTPGDLDAIRGNKVIAAFSCPKGSFDAPGIMEVVKTHRFALVWNAGKWDVIESSDARTVKDYLKRSEEKLKTLFQSMLEGFAYHRIVLGAGGRPADYIFLEVNDAFERLLGIKAEDIVGKRVTAAFPGIEKDPADWIGKYGAVALTGKPMQFESYSQPLGRWYTVSAFSDHRGFFATTFSDITERKLAEETSGRSLRRFEILADTAGELLRSREPRTAVESVCRKVMDHLECDVFFNFLADGKAGKLRLNACAGIPEEEAMRIEGAAPDDRTGLAISYGVKAYARYPLLGAGGKAFGTLSFGARGRETFGDEELSLMKAVTDHVAIAMTRIRNEEALMASLADKDLLMRELAHRTKNNMQVIGSLLTLQAAALPEKGFTAALSDTQDRIRAMALVHENLYRSGSVASLNIKDYVDDLVNSLLYAHRRLDASVRAVLDVDDLFLSIDEALPCGLIINELVSNSLKHAFPARGSGEISIMLRRAGDRVELRYRDDGPGLPRDLDLTRVKTLGLKLVYNLSVRQLRGTLDVRREPAEEIVIRFAGSNLTGRNRP
ncbi:MAG: histidine kinase dimerization/phosphoacceptor domain -containing protein [Thermodesulfobacteriota bacterium]